MISEAGQRGAFVPARVARTSTETADRTARSGELLIPLVVCATIVLSMALGIVPLTAFATLAALVTALVAPYIGLAIVAFMATLLSPSLVPAPGFAAAMVAAVLLGCVYRLPIERPRLRLSAPIVVILAILVFVTVQQAPEMLTGYATEADHGVGYLYLQLLSGFGAVIASIWLLRDRSPLPVLAMVIAGAVTGALIAILPYLLPSLEPFVVHVSGVSDDLIRASGTFSNPNYMAGSAAIALTLTVSLLPGIRSRAMQGATLASAIALGGAVLISLSRGGLITALVGLLAVGLTRGRRTAVVVLVIGLVGALVIYPAFVDWRLTNLTGSASAAAFQATSDSDAGRLEGALAGVALFLTSPLFGVGFGHYLEAAAQIPGTQVAHAAHNWYTYLLGEQGVAGAILWLLLLGFLVVHLLRQPAWPRSVGLSVAAALMAASLFLEVPTSFQTFAVPAIVLVAAIVGRWPLPSGAAGPASPVADAARADA